MVKHENDEDAKKNNLAKCKMITFVTILFLMAMVAAFGLLFYKAFGK